MREDNLALAIQDKDADLSVELVCFARGNIFKWNSSILH
jgi:hypothetical protein